MLHMISWKEYFTLMGLGLVLYYGWLLVRYYPGLTIPGRGKAGQGRQLLPDFVSLKAAVGVASGAGEVIGKPDQAVPAGKQETTQLELPLPVPWAPGKAAEIGGEGGLRVSSENSKVGVMPLPGEVGQVDQLPVPALIPKPMFLPELAGDLTNELRRLLERFSEGEMVEGEMLFAVEKLVGRETYCRLKGTLFEEKISVQVVRELEKHGSIHVDAEVVKGWWK